MSRVTKQQFIDAYLASKSYDELSTKLGISRQYCQIKASHYRTKLGLALPKFDRNKELCDEIKAMLE